MQFKYLKKNNLNLNVLVLMDIVTLLWSGVNDNDVANGDGLEKRSGWKMDGLRAEVAKLSANVEGGGVMVMLHGSMDGQPADRVLQTLQQDEICTIQLKDK